MMPAIALMLALAGADHIEAPIVSGARALGEEGRYESAKNFDSTIEWYKRKFKNVGGVRWRSIVNLPSIKAKHLQSIRRRTKWAGINIYEHQGRVRLFVVPREEPKREK